MRQEKSVLGRQFSAHPIAGGYVCISQRQPLNHRPHHPGRIAAPPTLLFPGPSIKNTINKTGVHSEKVLTNPE